MKQILLNTRGAMVVRMPRPVVARGQVLVRTRYSMVSVGTEIAPLRVQEAMAVAPAPEKARAYAALAFSYLGKAVRNPQKAARRLASIARGLVAPPEPPTPALQEAPAPPDETHLQGWGVGYSAAGEVLAVGPGVNDLAAGDVVACAGAGRANHAAIICVPRNLACRVPAGCSVLEAASTTLGTIALQGVRRAAPALGEVVCVLGLGLIGQITVQLLRANGCVVVGFDPVDARVERARLLGLAHGTHDADELKRILQGCSGGKGADRTLITAASASDAIINDAMALTRAQGTVVIVGDIGMKIRRDEFYRKEINLLMSTSYGPGRYDAAYEEDGVDYPAGHVRWTLNRNMRAYLDLVACGRVKIEPLIDRVAQLDDAPGLYRELAQGGTLLGVMLDYGAGGDDALEKPSIDIPVRPAVAGGQGYALVGVGAFGTAMLVPKMALRPDLFQLRAVVSRNQVNAANYARANGIERVMTDLEPVLEDPAITMVVIATRHQDHAALVARALRAGKHVFVEKPLALNWEELELVAQAYAARPNDAQLMVGFNRRFSPALQALTAALTERQSPLMMNYRLNAGYLPPDHWTQTAQGGGRNIGEACHMYDVFRSLSGAPLEQVDASSIDPATSAWLRNDNFSALLRYGDGSLGTLVYTALGPRAGLPKERLEVFCASEAWVLDDYRILTHASSGEVLWQGETDKGHGSQLVAWGEAIKAGAPAPIPFDELMETSAAALRIEDLLFGRLMEAENG